MLFIVLYCLHKNQKNANRYLRRILWKKIDDKGFDPTGSYTGRTDKGEAPIQDADDL